MLPAKNGCLAVIYHFLNDGFKNFTSVAAAAAAAVRKKNCFSLGEICPSNDHYGLPFLKWSVSNLTMHRRRQAGSIEKKATWFQIIPVKNQLMVSYDNNATISIGVMLFLASCLRPAQHHTPHPQ